MHGDMYETSWTKFQAHSLKTVAAAGSNMSPPPVREQLVNSLSFIHSATHCLVTHVIHSCHYAPHIHITAPPLCACGGVMHACISPSGSLFPSTKLLSSNDWLSNSPSPATVTASLSPQSRLTQSVNGGLIYSDSPLSTLHTVPISSADMHL
jgi:hypothetical protein